MKSSKNFWSRTRTEIKKLLWLAIPVTLSFFLFNVFSISVLFMVGQLSPEDLGAAALAIMLFNVMGEGIANGMMSAMDTLCSQAYGAGNYKKIGLILQRTCLIMLIIYISLVICWIFTEEILLVLAQDAVVSKQSSIFMHWLMPGLFFFYAFEIVRRLLLCQGITLPVFVVNAMVLPIHLTMSYLLIFVFDLGFVGAPIALSISFFLMFIFLTFYLFWKKLYVIVWDGFSYRAFYGWGDVLKLGIPGSLMITAEWISFEIHSIMSGWINTRSLAAQTALLNTAHLLFMFPFGVAIGAAIRVGHLLGSGSDREAKFSSVIALFLGEIISGIIVLLLFLTRIYWVQLFSNDLIVIEIIIRLTPLLCIIHLFDALQGVGSGVLRGCGKQAVGATVFILYLVIIGIPLGYTLSFLENLGISGLWLAMLFAIGSIAITFTVIIWLQNWRKLADEAHSSHSLKDSDPLAIEPIE